MAFALSPLEDQFSVYNSYLIQKAIIGIRQLKIVMSENRILFKSDTLACSAQKLMYKASLISFQVQFKLRRPQWGPILTWRLFHSPITIVLKQTCRIW